MAIGYTGGQLIKQLGAKGSFFDAEGGPWAAILLAAEPAAPPKTTEHSNNYNHRLIGNM